MNVEDDDTVCTFCGWPDCRCDDDDDDPDADWACTFCGGDGFEENDDPLWYGFDVAEIPCRACDGTGERKQQTIF